ncbi:hypothetical protein M569_00077 [Genlisea aurea]|uniref:Uncharacterized protein n=1 Tax=Genlisea aurea TaxID=192259 RepID=S8EP74_9LAMI|nr:hypothetical protein M569_00077 [Genlisea aurea]
MIMMCKLFRHSYIQDGMMTVILEARENYACSDTVCEFDLSQRIQPGSPVLSSTIEEAVASYSMKKEDRAAKLPNFNAGRGVASSSALVSWSSESSLVQLTR